jgi:hypothetical protein
MAAALRLRASDARKLIAQRLESLVAERVVHCLFK